MQTSPMLKGKLQLETKELKRIGHGIRWGIELSLIWLFVLPETGLWTALVLTLITVGIEFDHLDPRTWSR